MTKHTAIHDRIKSMGGEESHTEELVDLADKLFTSLKPEDRRPMALGLCQLESGFRNIYGADAVSNPIKSPSNAHPRQVTRANYEQYLHFRKLGEGMQGVGWTQLTYYTFQDRADSLGGCWIVKNQLQVGFEDLNGMIRQYGARDGLAAYNAGSGNRHGRVGQHYASLVLVHYNTWKRVTNR